ncbi:MAG: NADH-quinone oxidoreductase subunit B [Candidatus Asgardarchaeia archaeon]
MASITTKLKDFESWIRKSSIWPVRFCIACCSMEMAAAMGPRFDMERFGSIPAYAPRQADLLIVSGYLSKKMLKRLLKIYNQMPEPKYVLALGDCTMSGGPYWDSYSNAIEDLREYIPVDVFVPGCPPTPEAILKGLKTIQELIAKKKKSTLSDNIKRKSLEEELVTNEEKATE